MGFRTLRQCVETLRGEGEVIEIDYPIDPHREIAEIHLFNCLQAYPSKSIEPRSIEKPCRSSSLFPKIVVPEGDEAKNGVLHRSAIAW